MKSNTTNISIRKQEEHSCELTSNQQQQPKWLKRKNWKSPLTGNTKHVAALSHNISKTMKTKGMHASLNTHHTTTASSQKHNSDICRKVAILMQHHVLPLGTPASQHIHPQSPSISPSVSPVKVMPTAASPELLQHNNNLAGVEDKYKEVQERIRSERGKLRSILTQLH